MARTGATSRSMSRRSDMTVVCTSAVSVSEPRSTARSTSFGRARAGSECRKRMLTGPLLGAAPIGADAVAVAGGRGPARALACAPDCSACVWRSCCSLPGDCCCRCCCCCRSCNVGVPRCVSATDPAEAAAAGECTGLSETGVAGVDEGPEVAARVADWSG